MMRRIKIRSWFFIPLVASSVFSFFRGFQSIDESALFGVLWLAVAGMLAVMEVICGIGIYLRLFTKQDRPLSALNSLLFTSILPPSTLGCLISGSMIGTNVISLVEWVIYGSIILAVFIPFSCSCPLYYLSYQDAFVRSSNWLNCQEIPLNTVTSVQRIIGNLYSMTYPWDGNQTRCYLLLAGTSEQETFQKKLRQFQVSSINHLSVRLSFVL